MTKTTKTSDNDSSREAVRLPAGIEPMLDNDETMAALKIKSASTLYLMIRKGLIKPVKVLGSTRFHPDEVRRVQQGRAA
jgi:hypothetical protein